MTTPKRIFLIGYRGTGKTTVGRLLAERLGWRSVDADPILEERAGRTIAEIFATDGEAGFRDRESAILAELCDGPEQIVISTGGGVVLREENRERLKTSGFVAWLTVPPQIAWERLQADATTAARRPNLTASGGFEEVARLMSVREPLYRETANGTFATAGLSPSVIADGILSAWSTYTCSR